MTRHKAVGTLKMNHKEAKVWHSRRGGEMLDSDTGATSLGDVLCAVTSASY